MDIEIKERLDEMNRKIEFNKEDIDYLWDLMARINKEKDLPDADRWYSESAILDWPEDKVRYLRLARGSK